MKANVMWVVGSLFLAGCAYKSVTVDNEYNLDARGQSAATVASEGVSDILKQTPLQNVNYERDVEPILKQLRKLAEIEAEFKLDLGREKAALCKELVAAGFNCDGIPLTTPDLTQVSAIPGADSGVSAAVGGSGSTCPGSDVCSAAASWIVGD